VLRDEADVEDAFQATFLTLLRKAATIRRGQALAGWLFRVARNLALHARAGAGRRRECEARAPDRPAGAEASDSLSWREACAVLHEELDRLPEQFRLPLLLCYLQGQTRDEAAKQLGWSVQSLKGRLERGRQRLRDRLARRGVALSAGLLAALGDSAAAGVVPPRLLRQTLEAAGGRVPAAIAALANGVTPTMLKTRAPLLAVVLGIALAVTATAALAFPKKPAPSRVAGAESSTPRQLPGASKTPPRPPESVEVSGRVLGPDGKPVKGARISTRVYKAGKQEDKPRGTSGADGAFRFTLRLPRPEAPYSYGPSFQVMVQAEGLPPTWAWPATPGQKVAMTLRLVPDVTIRGRIVDLNGKPVAGAKLRIESIAF
jgi:RNA polymerase sigma factor (sigma-70 family)